MRKQLVYLDGIPRFVVEALVMAADPYTSTAVSIRAAKDALRRLEIVEDRNSEELIRRCA